MAKKEVITIDLAKRCNQDKVTVVMNVKGYGNVGGTTELLGAINLMHGAGIYPVIISADPSSNILKEMYGTRDANGALNNQVLGEGVITINLEKDMGELINVLWDESIAGRDVVIDFKGGNNTVFESAFNGLEPFFQVFEYTHRFFNIDNVNDVEKSIDNLRMIHSAFNAVECSTEIHLVRVFSLGLAGSDRGFEATIAKYLEEKSANPFINPSIEIHECEFKTKLTDLRVLNFFATRNIRKDWCMPGAIGLLKVLVPQFLNERDKAWSKLLFSSEFIAEIAQLTNPLYTPSPNAPKWGKVLYGHQWNG